MIKGSRSIFQSTFLNVFLPIINRAFLFTLVNSEGVPPTKYDVTHPKYATLHHPRFVDKNNF